MIDINQLELDETPPKKERKSKKMPGQFSPNPAAIPRCKTCKFWDAREKINAESRAFWSNPDMSEAAPNKTYGACELMGVIHHFEDGDPFTGDAVTGLWITSSRGLPTTYMYTLETFGCTEHKEKKRR